MTLTLTLPALERLIGGDTEMELNLRKQIVQEFTERHLKSVADSALYAKAEAQVKQYVDAAAKEVFDIDNLTSGVKWPTASDRLKSMIETLVRAHAQKAVDAALLSIIEYQKRYWGQEIERAVKKEMGRQIEKEVAKGIQERLEAATNMGKVVPQTETEGER